MHYIVFKTIINDNFGIHKFYPVLPMGKTYPFTHFYPVLPNRFYPVGKTYHANPPDHWDVSDLWPRSIIETISPIRHVIISRYLEIFRELNKLIFNFVPTFYTTILNRVNRKTILTFWPLSDLGQGHSKPNRLEPRICSTTPRNFTKIWSLVFE